MPKQETTTRFTKQRWFESNDYGKECFVDELLASHGSLLAALEAVMAHGEWDATTCNDCRDVIEQARAVIAQAKVAS